MGGGALNLQYLSRGREFVKYLQNYFLKILYICVFWHHKFYSDFFIFNYFKSVKLMVKEEKTQVN